MALFIRWLLTVLSRPDYIGSLPIFLLLTKFKSVEFFDKSFQLHSNSCTIAINFTDLTA